MAGKNKVERSFRIYWDDSGGSPRDLSGDLVPGSIGGGGLVYDEADMTGVSDGVKNYLTGHPTSDITGRFHMNDTATTGASTVLNGQDGDTGTITMEWGQAGAAPTTGDPTWSGEYVQLSNTIVLDGNRFVHEVTWKPYGTTAPQWGTK